MLDVNKAINAFREQLAVLDKGKGQLETVEVSMEAERIMKGLAASISQSGYAVDKGLMFCVQREAAGQVHVALIFAEPAENYTLVVQKSIGEHAVIRINGTIGSFTDAGSPFFFWGIVEGKHIEAELHVYVDTSEAEESLAA